MKKVIFYLLLLCLLFLCSCDDKPNSGEKTIEPKIYETTEIVSTGNLFLNKDNPIKNLEIVFFSNEYDFGFDYQKNKDDYKIVSLVGENTDKINIEMNYCSASGIDGYKHSISQYSLYFNVSTFENNESVVKLDQIQVKIKSSIINIFTNFIFNIEPKIEFANTENGSLLFYYLGGYQLGEVIMFYNSSLSYNLQFNDSDRFLNNDGDYFVIDKIEFAKTDLFEINNQYYALNGWDEYKKKIENNSFSDKISNDIYSFEVGADYLMNNSRMCYFSIVMDYHFNYDETSRKVCLGMYHYAYDDISLRLSMENKINGNNN